MRNLNKLNISRSGIDSTGRPYVQLTTGEVFFGKETNKKEKKFYRFLLKSTKEKLYFECFQIACDIVVRYKGGGLKFRGPKKEQYYSAKEGDVVVEMGAYQGFYTIYLAKRVGNKGKVIAIEPIEENVNLLKINVEKNKLSNVTIVPKGVWSKEGVKNFFRNENDRQSGSIDLNYTQGEKFQITVDSLDNILTKIACEEVDLMLIQLNGAEYEALLGMKTIRPKNMAIAARYDKEKVSAARLIYDLLEKRQYKVIIDSKRYVYAHKKR